LVSSAAKIAEALSEELHLYHACRPWDEVTRRGSQLQHIPEIEQADARSAYHQELERPLRELASRYNVSPHHIRVVEARIAEALPAFAKAMSSDIVVVGAVARPFLKRVLIGHTAERIIERLQCDVLVVKSPEFRSPVSARSEHRTNDTAALRGRYVW
jgi:universal stress protein E